MSEITRLAAIVAIGVVLNFFPEREMARVEEMGV
jgi:hypothetical protein